MLGRGLGKGVRCAALALGLALLFGNPAAAQDPFVSYNFDDDRLDDFFLPIGVDFCGTLLPTGTASADGGEVVLSTDNFFGFGLFSLLPEIVKADFPTSRDMKIKVRFRFDPDAGGGQVTQFELAIRGRGDLDLDLQVYHLVAERVYYISVSPEFVPGLPLDGAISISEFTACHAVIEHNEWPPGGLGPRFVQEAAGYIVCASRKRACGRRSFDRWELESSDMGSKPRATARKICDKSHL